MVGAMMMLAGMNLLASMFGAAVVADRVSRGTGTRRQLVAWTAAPLLVLLAIALLFAAPSFLGPPLPPAPPPMQ